MNERRGRGREILLASLISGATVSEAAKAAGVAERTAYRRLADVRFREQLAAAGADVVEAARARIQVAAAKAADTAIELMEDGYPPQVRLAAARSVLGLAFAFPAAEQNVSAPDVSERTRLGDFLRANPSRVGPVVAALDALRQAVPELCARFD